MAKLPWLSSVRKEVAEMLSRCFADGGEAKRRARRFGPATVEALEARRLLTSVWIETQSSEAYEDGGADFVALIKRSDSDGALSVRVAFPSGESPTASTDDFTVQETGGIEDVGTDYYGFGANAVFADEQDTVTLTIKGVRDLPGEDAENFNVVISNALSNEYTLSEEHDVSVVGQVIDIQDTFEYLVSIEDNGETMAENDGTLTFIVNRSMPEDASITHIYSIIVHVKTSGIDDDEENSADADDYDVVTDEVVEWEASGGYYKINFGLEDESASLSIVAVGDNVLEPQEWMKVVLLYGAGSPRGATIDPEHSQAFGGIDDDDQAIRIAVDDGLASEDGDTGRLAAYRYGKIDAELDVPITFSGDAVFGTDFELFPNAVDGRDNLSGFSDSVDEHDAVDQFL